jgi:hypothetical protein
MERGCEREHAGRSGLDGAWPPPTARNPGGGSRDETVANGFPLTLVNGLHRAAGMAQKKKSRPAWLRGATDICHLCEQPHSREMLRYCAACDHAICEHCCREGAEAHELLCSRCHDEDEVAR